MKISDSSDSRTSATLILEVQRGYPEAWERFVRLYGPLIYAWCRQCRLQEADAADCLQNVMRSLQGGIAEFAADGLVITHNSDFLVSALFSLND